MAISTLEGLLKTLAAPSARSPLHAQMYFKPALTALSHAMEDQVLAATEPSLVIATFQRERFYRQEAHRYLRIASRTPHVYVLAAPETDFCNRSEQYETIAFTPEDILSQEWNLVVINPRFASCLICQERESRYQLRQHMDTTRRFEGIWTFERPVTIQAADLLLGRILDYRPELADKVAEARQQFLQGDEPGGTLADPGPFAERLVTYLQAGQYKLLKAYRSIAAKERRESLVNRLTTAIRQSLNLQEILGVATQELGQTLRACRCLIYACRTTDAQVRLQQEFRHPQVPALAGQIWPLQDNPLVLEAVQRQGPLYLESVPTASQVQASPWLQQWVAQGQIQTWLLVPVLYQGELVGMIELHRCQGAHQEAREDTAERIWATDPLGSCFPLEDVAAAAPWGASDWDLVEAIAPQIGVALIQSSAYTHLEQLNQQLEALERTRYNLTAIVGHELRTPLATVKVCLESMAMEPDMPPELRQVMLNTALGDAERLRELVQDFLVLSQLESGRVEFHPEALPLQECLDLALSSLNGRQLQQTVPQIQVQLPPDLPLICADGERLVEVFSKLLDNACKFTAPEGEIVVQARLLSGQVSPNPALPNQALPNQALSVVASDSLGPRMLEVTVRDTGRGIEPDRLEVIFDRFYQEEGALRRTTGGTGLGLAICRQIIIRLGGKIWAESQGRDRGTCFHFTVPLAEGLPTAVPQSSRKKVPVRRRNSA